MMFGLGLHKIPKTAHGNVAFYVVDCIQKDNVILLK